MRPVTHRSLAFSIGAVLLICCTEPAPAANQLATDQTLRIPIKAEPRAGGTSLDPARLDFSLENAIGENIFDGLYRYDEQMREQPDLALGMPVVSPDGLSYTFRLRKDARFWNGVPVTAADVMYSWTRAVALQGGWATVFQPVVGYAAVAASPPGAAWPALSGLSAPDPYTVVARLSAPTGYWLAELALPVAWVVSRAAVEAGGPEKWWTTPDGLVGTGPFRMTNWSHNVELDFAALQKWWGGSTGAIRRVELRIEADADARWKGYAEGRYDILGFGRTDFGVTDTAQLAALRSDPGHRAQVHTWPFGTTTYLAFNLQSGPFSGYGDGKALRRAFSQAIDRQKLAQDVCQGGTVCVPATGGLISRGLHGYLGDGTDPGAKFDPKTARATVKRLDPDGSRLRGLVFYYPILALDPAQAMAENLRAQWSANLSVDVTIRALDSTTFFTNALRGSFLMWRQGWEADYDHPQDWFDNLFQAHADCGELCTTAGAVYDQPGYAEMIASADKKSLAEALPAYLSAGRMLLEDSAFGALYYHVRSAVLKPYVDGYGANALWDYRWTSIRIMQH